MNGQTRNEEFQALEILKVFVSNDIYGNCVIKDMPDIQNENGSIGIEVVTACLETDKRIEGPIHSNTIKDINGEAEKYSQLALSRILKDTKTEGIVVGGKMAGYKRPLLFDFSLDTLKSFVIGKEEKAKEYASFSRLELFIIDQLDYLDCTCFKNVCNQLHEWYLNKTKDSSIPPFQTLYIYRYGYSLLMVLDIVCKKVKEINNVRVPLDQQTGNSSSL